MTKPATAGGALLRRWRQGEGLTQREAAKRLGIAQSTYSAVETGRRQPTKPQAAKLAEVAGITAADWTTPADGEG
jgi:transcriptional regulator with XRE-family HTH domain